MFPRTQVENLSLSRMIIGTNWLLGWSHTGAAADATIKSCNHSPEAISKTIEAFLSYGIDTIMGPLAGYPISLDAIKIAEDKTGKKIIRIDTPTINVNDSDDARKEAMKTLKACKDGGAEVCLIHHSSCEQLVNKNKRTIERIEDYTYMIRELGMIPGLSAHMPEVILYSDANEYDIQTYIQIYNCVNFLMQVEVELIHTRIWSAKKPVMTIKPMAAGRTTPFVGITFAFNTIRDCDMVTVGCMSPHEVHEDVEIALAAIERRKPNLSARSSPTVTDIMR